MSVLSPSHPPALLRPRMPHQLAAIAWGEDKTHCGYYLDKRLGKCAVAISHALNKSDVNRALIVTPVTAFLGWCSDLGDDNQSYVLLHAASVEKRYKLLKDADENETKFYIVNPQGLFSPAHREFRCERCRWYPPEKKPGCGACEGSGKVKIGRPVPNEIALMPWDMVIWDESVSLANPTSQTNTIAHACFSDTKYKVVLSGEYIPRSVEQVFEQMRWMFGHFMGHRRFWNWRREFFRENGFHQWTPTLDGIKAIKEAVMARCYILSRKDAGLGGKVARDVYYCELPPKIRKMYEHAEKFYEIPLPAMEGCTDPEYAQTKYAPVVDNWKAQIVGGCPKAFPHLQSPHKMKLLFALLCGEFKHDFVVVRFRYNAELSAALKIAKKKGIKYFDLHGGYPSSERMQIAAEFKRGYYRVLFCQIKAIKYGLDLSRADTMISYSLPYDYDDISQSKDRIVHPLKQTTPLLYVDLVCRDTIDEDIMEAVWEKNVNASNFMSRAKNRFAARVQPTAEAK